MKNKIKEAKAYIEKQIQWQKESLERDRAVVVRAAKISDSDTIISRAKMMRESEIRLHDLYQQLSLVEYLLND